MLNNNLKLKESAIRILEESQRIAEEHGLSNMTLEEINREIQSAKSAEYDNYNDVNLKSYSFANLCIDESTPLNVGDILYFLPIYELDKWTALEYGACIEIGRVKIVAIDEDEITYILQNPGEEWNLDEEIVEDKSDFCSGATFYNGLKTKALMKLYLYKIRLKLDEATQDLLDGE